MNFHMVMMAVEEVACPYCGKVTYATIARDSEIAKLAKNRRKFSFLEKRGGIIDVGCTECDHTFYIKQE